jgi:glutamate-1-semialdehyde 2,1-aminomutase
MRKTIRFDGEMYRRACESIAHGALTNSKRSESFVKGVYPTHLKKGFGCRVLDTNNNEYVDFICGLGSNLLGYAQDEITEAITRQAKLGSILSLGTELEVLAAERVKSFFPFIEKLRFLKTGSDACSAAIRIARAYTGRAMVYSEGYHGWHDEFVSLTPPAIGVVKHSLPKIQNLSDLRADAEKIAAIIVEPIITDSSKERIEWLRGLRQTCTKMGALLIFDEVITGLRFPQYSVAQEYDIYPDLICLGKSLGGGLPIGVVGGRGEVMESPYFVSSTFAGETLSLSACVKTLELLQNKYKIELLWEKGLDFLSKFNALWPEGVALEGYPTRSKFIGDEKNIALFMQECCKAGILVGPSFFLCFPHLEILDEVLSTFKDILTRIRLGEIKLEGEMPKKPYAESVRGKS